MREIKAHGGQIMLDTSVAAIHVQRGRATAVQLADGTEIRAKFVVSNADPALALGSLVGSEHMSRKTRAKLRRTRYALSNIYLFAAVDMDLAGQGFDSGNYWYNRTADLERTYQDANTGASINRSR